MVVMPSFEERDCSMKNEADIPDQADDDEVILINEVSDEALEAAASTARDAVNTGGMGCTITSQFWRFCC
jgi:hypothetical protein